MKTIRKLTEKEMPPNRLTQPILMPVIYSLNYKVSNQTDDNSRLSSNLQRHSLCRKAS